MLFWMQSKRSTTVKNDAQIILCDNSIFITFSKIYVIQNFCDKKIFSKSKQDIYKSYTSP
jgi:hypothetical protein